MDKCSFTGHDIGQGNDVAQMVIVDDEYCLWCGLCREGMDAMWSAWTDERLRAESARLHAQLADSGLDWDHRGNDFGAWVDWVHTHDLADAMMQYIELRADNGTDH